MPDGEKEVRRAKRFRSNKSSHKNKKVCLSVLREPEIPVVDPVKSWKQYVKDKVDEHANTIADDIRGRLERGETTTQGLVVNHTIPDEYLKHIHIHSRTKASRLWSAYLQYKLRIIVQIINEALQKEHRKQQMLSMTKQQVPHKGIKSA